MRGSPCAGRRRATTSGSSWRSPPARDAAARGPGARLSTAGKRERGSGKRTLPRARRLLYRGRRGDGGAAGPQRLRQDHHPEAHQSVARADRRRGTHRRRARPRRAADPVATPHRVRHSGGGAVSALHGGAQRGARAAAGRVGDAAHRGAVAGAPGGRGSRSGYLRRPPSAPALGRPTPARGCGTGPRRGPAAAAPGRAVRRPRPDHARRADARDAHRPHATGQTRLSRDTARVPRERASGVQAVHGGRMSLWGFYSRNAGEVLGLVGQHLSLVASSTVIAIVVGVPGGILLTRRPAWRAPVLGLANLFQTIPSLALFGFLIPLPFIGGIGATTAIVALVVYALLPIVRNTYTGIAGVDPAVREAGRGMGMTDWELLTQVELPLALGVILAGVRVATVVSVGTATIAAAIGAGGLGVYIFRGVAVVDDTLILAGALPAALMALAADALFGLAERRFAWRAE